MIKKLPSVPTLRVYWIKQSPTMTGGKKVFGNYGQVPKWQKENRPWNIM